MNKRSLVVIALLLLVSCGKKGEKKQSSEQEKIPAKITVPVFNADSAYYFVQEQVAFGPRIPNTNAHRQAYAPYFTTWVT